MGCQNFCALIKLNSDGQEDNDQGNETIMNKGVIIAQEKELDNYSPSNNRFDETDKSNINFFKSMNNSSVSNHSTLTNFTNLNALGAINDNTKQLDMIGIVRENSSTLPKNSIINEINNTTNRYIGEYLFLNNDKLRHGSGKILTNEDAVVYDGRWSNDLPNGLGIFTGKAYVYEGEFKDATKHGKGTLYTTDKKYYYNGDWENDLQNGQGEEILDGVLKYKGNYKCGQKDGEGKMILANGSYYEGVFKNNKIEGQGKFCWSKAKYYTGEWRDNNIEGFGKLYSTNKIHKGYFKENLKYGIGMNFNIAKETISVGEWKEDKLTSPFLLYSASIKKRNSAINNNEEKEKDKNQIKFDNKTRNSKNNLNSRSSKANEKDNLNDNTEEVLICTVCNIDLNGKIAPLSVKEQAEFRKTKKFKEFSQFFTKYNN